MKALKIIFKIIKYLLTTLVVLILAVVLIQRFSNNNIKVFGYSIYTIVSESMKPEYDIGDMIFVKNVDKQDIKLNDDIVYMGNIDSYDGKIITHRVIRIDNNQIVTKGINNPIEDPPIKYDQVYGKVAFKLCILSTFSKLMNNNLMFYIIVFVPFTILIFLDLRDIVLGREEREEEKEKEKITEQERNNVQETNNDNIEILEDDVEEESKE